VSRMDDFNFDALDLGSRRKPTNWVAVAPPMVYRHKINPNKRWIEPYQALQLSSLDIL
jgi:hypothetical protein